MSYIVPVYPPYPNKYERALILVMLDRKVITRHDQSVYTNKLAFKRAVKELHDWEIIVWKHERNGSNEYKLTLFGEHIANDLLKFSRMKV